MFSQEYESIPALPALGVIASYEQHTILVCWLFPLTSNGFLKSCEQQIVDGGRRRDYVLGRGNDKRNGYI
jgi:hypothetical protein